MSDSLTSRLHEINIRREPIVLDLRKRIAELGAERDKLRAALENVSRIPIPEGHVIQQPCEACKKRVKIAREALKGGKS